MSSSRHQHDSLELFESRDIRFPFGKNWSRFLQYLNEDRIEVAKQSLQHMLGRNDLSGLRFIDVGSGSGLFSLAARMLGAHVYSIDYDPFSVSCTQYLRQQYYPDDPHWHISQGSILDAQLVNSLGQFDIVYSWGVLHHTGDMWKAFSLVDCLVKPDGGILFLSIYNDQGALSRFWKWEKRNYNRYAWFKYFAILGYCSLFISYRFLRDVLSLRNPFLYYKNYARKRGMSWFHDMKDWLGGYPFEVALNRDELISLLLKAKVYIDFGNHPGKDRIPREAAILGCCVLTSNRGSAAFIEDIPIPKSYKFPDCEDMIPQIINSILDCLNNFEKRSSDFIKYREIIKNEPSKFISDLKNIFLLLDN